MITVLSYRFPGWLGRDPVNTFTGEGLTPQQLEAQNWFKTLAIFARTAVHSTPENCCITFLKEKSTCISELLNLNIMVVATVTKKARPLTCEILSRIEPATSGGDHRRKGRFE